MKYRDLNFSFKIDGTKFTFPSLVLEKLTTIPTHSHAKDCYELHYVSFGRGVLNSDGVRYDIEPGTLFMTGPEIEHEQISDPENPMTEYCVYIKINQSQKKGSSGLSEVFTSTPFWFGQDDGTVHELMKSTFSELEGYLPGRELMISALMQQLILNMIRRYQSSQDEWGSVKTVDTDGDKVYLIIEEAFLYGYKSITLCELANKLGLGKRQTQRLLMRHYSKTFQEKKTEARMFAACTLLRDHSKSVSKISEELGYSSCEHFSSSFKKYYGVSPTEFRRQNAK